MEKIAAFLLAHQAGRSISARGHRSNSLYFWLRRRTKRRGAFAQNILVNAAQAAARIDFGRTDKVFNVLPVFHRFGLSIGLILPLVSGVPVDL